MEAWASARGFGVRRGLDRFDGLAARAMDAQEREQWEIAEQGFIAAIGANPRFTAAHEALFDLHRLQNRNTDAIGDALRLAANTPSGQYA